MAKGFDLIKFVRIAGGFSLIGIGASIAGTSTGDLARIIIGFVSAGIGVALLLIEE